MASENKKILYFTVCIFLLTIPLKGPCFSKLPTLKTKQNIHNIRFISKNGKFTYYQRGTGQLHLSTNYAVTEILKGSKYTHYTITGHNQGKNLIISSFRKYQKYFNVKTMADLFVIKYGKAKATSIGHGVNPRLHLNESWVSFYNPKKQIIFFKHLSHHEISLEIKINNPIRPYFIPEVIMPSKEMIYYTDIDKKGRPNIVFFNVPEKKFSIFYKAHTHLAKIELCLQKNNLFIGRFGLDSIHSGSKIHQIISTKKIKFSQAKEIYTSRLNDVGNMICHIDQHIYFSKNIKINKQVNNFEIVSLLPKDGKTTILSDLQYITQLFAMDDKIILPHRGQYLLLVGDNLKHDDSILGATK